MSKYAAMVGMALGVLVALGYVFFYEKKPAVQAQTNAQFHVKPTTESKPMTENTTTDSSTDTAPTTTESGLTYRIITPGSGAHPSETDQVTVNYEGKLLDGTVFDSSYKRGQPATFGLNQVIKGWTEGLQLMQPGATWELTIPPELAYGERGIPGTIPPGSTLVFKVELLAINGGS